MHHTDIEVTLKNGMKTTRFFVPHDSKRALETLLNKMQKHDDGNHDFISAEVAFPELLDPVKKPATMLRGLRYREGLTQAKLAKKLGVRQHHLSEMENGKRPIGKAMAKDFAKALRADYRIFL